MAKKKAKGPKLAYLIVDKSGSMEPIRDATIAGVNQFQRETAEANPDTLLSVLLFDTQITKPFVARPIGQAEPLDIRSYVPGGGTSLLDAMGHAMSDIEAMPEKPSKTVVVVMTDGGENSSHEYTRAAVKAAIDRHEREDGWQFVYLGANVDSFAEAGAIGVARSGSTANWQPTAAGTSAVYTMASTVSNSFLAGATPTADVNAEEYGISLDSALKGTSESIGTRMRSYKGRRETEQPKP